MTIDTDKLKALALAAPTGPWTWGSKYVARPAHGTYFYVAQCPDGEEDTSTWENKAAYIATACPATVLELIAEVERLRADAARIDFMITDECQIERMDRIGTAPVYRVRWPWLEEQQAEWSASGRDAIDAAIEARTKAKRDTK